MEVLIPNRILDGSVNDLKVNNNILNLQYYGKT